MRQYNYNTIMILQCILIFNLQCMQDYSDRQKQPQTLLCLSTQGHTHKP
jgi:hypothetical protein